MSNGFKGQWEGTGYRTRESTPIVPVRNSLPAQASPACLLYRWWGDQGIDVLSDGRELTDCAILS